MSEEKQIEELAEILRKVCDATPNGKCISKLCCACRAETVIEAGYRKQSEGEWKKSEIPGEEYVCSVCGCACWYYDVEGYVAKSRFCPNCGARMKGGA